MLVQVKDYTFMFFAELMYSTPSLPLVLPVPEAFLNQSRQLLLIGTLSTSPAEITLIDNSGSEIFSMIFAPLEGKVSLTSQFDVSVKENLLIYTMTNPFYSHVQQTTA